MVRVLRLQGVRRIDRPGGTFAPASPPAKAAHQTIIYTSAPITMRADHSAAMQYRLTFGILAARKDAVAAFAESHKREPVISIPGPGAGYGVACSFAICIVREMQWVHSTAILAILTLAHGRGQTGVDATCAPGAVLRFVMELSLDIGFGFFNQAS
jgi:hypothetical protein